MKHAERIEEYIDHILQAIDDITEYIGTTRNEATFSANKMMVHAVICNFEIMGEAVGRIQKVDPDFPSRYPEIPWVRIKDMRNKLSHEYSRVLPRVIWDTAHYDLPGLRRQLRDLLKKQSETS